MYSADYGVGSIGSGTEDREIGSQTFKRKVKNTIHGFRSIENIFHVIFFTC